jgi:hypothetical protein
VCGVGERMSALERVQLEVVANKARTTFIEVELHVETGRHAIPSPSSHLSIFYRSQVISVWLDSDGP